MSSQSRLIVFRGVSCRSCWILCLRQVGSAHCRLRRLSISGPAPRSSVTAPLLARSRHNNLKPLWQHSRRNFPILRAAIRDGHFIEREQSPVTPFIWLDRASHDLETLYQEALQRPLDPTAAIYTVHVLADAAGFDILMLSSHAIADATALVAIHSSLMHFCDLRCSPHHPAGRTTAIPG